jgi:hypothetical protein
VFWFNSKEDNFKWQLHQFWSELSEFRNDSDNPLQLQVAGIYFTSPGEAANEFQPV